MCTYDIIYNSICTVAVPAPSSTLSTWKWSPPQNISHINNDMNININIDINMNIDITPPHPMLGPSAEGPGGEQGVGWGGGNPLWVYFHIGYRILGNRY